MGRVRAIPSLVGRSLRRGRDRRRIAGRSPIVRQCDEELALIVEHLSSG